MNNQIRQLAEQAGIVPVAVHTNPLVVSYHMSHETMETFVKLIVQECSGFRNELGIALCNDPSALHRYFGVEE